MTKDAQTLPPISGISKPTIDIQKNINDEIAHLQDAWGIEYHERAPEMVDGALKNLALLLEEAGGVGNVLSPADNIKDLLQDIIGAQEALIRSLQYQRLAYLHDIEQNCEAIKQAGAAGNGKAVLHYNEELQKNLTALQNMPSIEEQAANLQGLKELVNIQTELNSNSKDSDLKFRQSATTVVNGLKKSYETVNNFTKKPEEPKKEDVELAGRSKKVLKLSEEISAKDIEATKAKIAAATQELSAARTDFAGFGQRKQEAQSVIDKNDKLAKDLKSKQDELARARPSFANRLTLGVYKDKKMQNLEKDVKKLTEETKKSGLDESAIKDLKAHAALMNQQSQEAEIKAKKLQDDLAKLKEELAKKEEIAAKIASQKENLKENTKKNQGIIDQEKSDNQALQDKIGAYSKAIIKIPGLDSQGKFIAKIQEKQSAQSLSEQFKEGLNDELDLVRLTLKGLAKTTRTDPRLAALSALNQAAGYIPVPGASYAATLLLMGAQYLVNKDIQNASKNVNGHGQVANMAAAIDLVAEELAKSYANGDNSPLSHLTEKGVKSLSALAVTKIIEAMSRDPKDGGLQIPEGASPQEIADLMLETIHEKRPKSVDKTTVVARSQRGQISSKLETKDKADKDWKGTELLEQCGIITESGEKFVSVHAKNGAKYGFRLASAKEEQELANPEKALAMGFTKYSVVEEKKGEISDAELLKREEAQTAAKKAEHDGLKNTITGIVTNLEAEIRKSVPDSAQKEEIVKAKMEQLLKSLRSATANNDSIKAAIQTATGTNNWGMLAQAKEFNANYKKDVSLQVELDAEWAQKYPPAQKEIKEAPPEIENSEVQARKEALQKSLEALEREIIEHLKPSGKTKEGLTAQEVMAQLLDQAGKDVNKAGVRLENPFNNKVTTEDKDAFKNIVKIDTGKRHFLTGDDATKDHFHKVVQQYNAVKHDLYDAKMVDRNVNVQAEYQKAQEAPLQADEIPATRERSGSFLKTIGTGVATVGVAAGIAIAHHPAIAAVVLVGGLGSMAVNARRESNAAKAEENEALPKAEAAGEPGYHVRQVMDRREKQQDRQQ